jgi:radical SAM superfamily enzyme YgiQ (UPF0313 family)
MATVAETTLLLIQAGPTPELSRTWGGTATEQERLLRRYSIDPETLEVGARYAIAPLPIATLAALTAPWVTVDLWDENVDGSIDAATSLPRQHYDVVGVSVMFAHFEPRLRQLAALFRSRGSFVVAGGPAVSRSAARLRRELDAVFGGEAELTWPEFWRDWADGRPRSEYIQVDRPDLMTSPVPRWSLLGERLRRYSRGAVQSTRGCPFDCDFCDVTYFYGRAQRHKPVESVLDEVRALDRLGSRRIVLVDDELVGDPPYARSLLRGLVELNRQLRHPCEFATQLTINLARDAELLELVADANFHQVLIGVESFRDDTLRERRKHQNVGRDLVGDLRRILSYGIGITASFIAGNDQDGPESFEELDQGIRAACVPVVGVSSLRAYPGTRLWAQLRSDDRIVQLRTPPRARNLVVQIQPRRMTRIQLLEGLRWLHQRVYDWDLVGERLRGWADLVTRPPRVAALPLPLDRAVAAFRGLSDELGLSPAALAAIEGTLEHTHEVAPFLLDRVVNCLFSNDYERRYRGAYSDDDFREAIALEEKGDLVTDRTQVAISRERASVYERMFPAVIQRLWPAVAPDEVARAAGEVVAAFHRRTAEIEDVAAQLPLLLELCDDVAARRGRTRDPGGESSAAAPLAAFKRNRLFEPVLRHAEYLLHDPA